MLIAVSVFSAFADTIYVVNGYSYTVINNSSIRLVDWNTEISDTLTVPDSIAGRNFISVGNWAFENRTDLKGLDLSQAAHLQQIGYEAFIGCSEIASDIVLPESVVVLNERCFCDCSSVSNIIINGKLKYVPTESFYGCSSAKTVVLPETLQTIGSWAFGECTELEYAVIPKSVSVIADTAFKNDPNLVLGVYKDTYGLQYAEDNRIDHIILDGPKIGDVNFDGAVDILDSTEIQKYAAEMTEFTDEQFALGDINKDGYCDVIDALLVQKSVVGKYDIPQNIIRY